MYFGFVKVELNMDVMFLIRLWTNIYNEQFIFVALAKLVEPLTFNDDNDVVAFCNIENPLILNEDNIVVLFEVEKNT